MEPFETRAAIEVALMTRNAKSGGDKKGGLDAPWAKVKFDRQIVAIAKVVQASAIYTDDGDIVSIARNVSTILRQSCLVFRLGRLAVGSVD